MVSLTPSDGAYPSEAGAAELADNVFARQDFGMVAPREVGAGELGEDLPTLLVQGAPRGVPPIVRCAVGLPDRSRAR